MRTYRLPVQDPTYSDLRRRHNLSRVISFDQITSVSQSTMDLTIGQGRTSEGGIPSVPGVHDFNVTQSFSLGLDLDRDP
jgi:hypothetical protein